MIEEQKGARCAAGCDDEAARAQRTRERLSHAKPPKIRGLARGSIRTSGAGAKGGVRLSNRTDNDSAKIGHRQGARIQGYTGRSGGRCRAHQIRAVDAQARTARALEQELLLPVIGCLRHHTPTPTPANLAPTPGLSRRRAKRDSARWTRG
ncbi:hypothetical protein [Methyloversatilis thermotolerans]|uniref:hypothetical protein n=1 Tax=Methyloversatilis thermotolerans TaxID=1346290 RepID=UPI0018DED3A2|nr:hypothetical protein [Methyloversatilis thermotolerans]